jgi:general secretion pathway protein G
MLNHQPSTINPKRVFGFTLIELLVVISLIAILVTLGLTSFATAQKKGRDTKRKSDIKEIQGAMETYYSVCGYKYPELTPPAFFTSIVCSSPSLAIMPTVPSDPRTTPYACPTSTDCTASSYRICATLESETPSSFCVSNQQ